MKIYNTLTRKKEVFIPIDSDEVKIYVCGPTVYNYFHIGNARPFVVFDTLRKYLEYRGYNVKYVQNFTDVDDKIINKANEEGCSAAEISERFILEYFKDAEALQIKKATAHPKVTENIDEIIEFISCLLDKGYAYVREGDVYFKIRNYPEYGKLSRQKTDDLELGARVDINEEKSDPLDFTLWKLQKAPSEPAWESPWGAGRPGWHIECSAMAGKYLGETIDIHAGGQDLTFPHHENEIAQSEAKSGKKFANYWMHNGYITINNEKMSKSLDNFFTVRDILKDFDGETIRFFLLSGHYRNPVNFSREMMEQAKNSLNRIKNAVSTLIHLKETGFADSVKGEIPRANTLEPAEDALAVDTQVTTQNAELSGLSREEKITLIELLLYRDNFCDAMDDDLNTADAISAIFEMVSKINTAVVDGASPAFAQRCLDALRELTGILGILPEEEQHSLSSNILALIDERQEARAAKDFARSDEIRDILKSKGITLKDTPQGIQIVMDS
ncbi:MAG: cysteine--tRNA ligase [Oscillospiraceae bacterium]|nr:cysteine--tRNA ligase [Oscillospiraceae bacterium]